MAKTYRTCAECGARLADEAVQCGLCGTLVDETDAALTDSVAEPAAALPSEEAAPAESEAPTPPPAATASAKPADRPAAPAGVYCNQCGWKNPPGARFCSMCGAPLQAVDPSLVPAREHPDSPPAPVPARLFEKAQEDGAARASAKAAPTGLERKALSRQVGIIVGAGVLLVLALFLVTAVSKTRPAGAPIQPAQQAPLQAAAPDDTPLPAQLAEQVTALEDEIAQLDGAARTARQRDLIALFFSAGRMDRAALEQQKIAEVTGAIDDWKRAGDLFYDWMNTLPEGARKAQIATQAIAAYQTLLEQDPDNLDVRTDMATAYLSSGNPMLGVAEVKRVLDADSTHLHARFNYGLMLSWINRPEQAIEQFERVKALVDETSDYYRQADEALRVIRQGGPQ